MAVRDATTLAETAARQWGAAAVRVARPAGSPAGHADTLVLEPSDAAVAGDMLRWAEGERVAVVPCGGGTKLRWDASPTHLDAVLSTARLTTGIEHCAGDLTAVLPAGATLASVNDRLGRERQWLTLDPAHARATIGGIVATNDSGPRRHRFGAPRDLIIGIEMVLVDGRKAKAGGRVVKNVAGYDLSRLMCGSYGSLAVITSATFKLSPIAPASRTVVMDVPNLATLGDLLRDLVEAPLTPSACEIDAPPLRLLVRLESTELSAEHQSAAAVAIAGRRGTNALVVTGDAETELWRTRESAVWTSEGTLIKVAVLPSDVPAMLEHVARLSASGSVTYRAGGRAALGVLFVRLSGRAETHPSIVTDLRRAAHASGRGSVVVLEADSALRATIDVWGEIGDALPVMRAVKVRFDPHGTLSPGRGPGGL